MTNEELILPSLIDKITYDIDDERRISSDFFQNEKSDKKETIKKKQTSEKEYKTKIEKDNKITPITIIKTNQIETTNHLFPLNNIFCSLHQKDYIKFDSDSFSIVCTKCLDEGKESHLQFINNNEINIIKKEKKILSEDEITCFNHNNKKGSFYCDECKEFICKFCFAEEHKKHKCHLPEIISEEFKKYINESISDAEKLKPILDNAIDEVSEICSNLKVQKNDIIKVPSTIIERINEKNNNQIEEFLKKFINLLDNLDNEVDTDYNRHIQIKEKVQNYIKELDEISKKIKNDDNSLNNFQLCIYHKKSKEKITEIDNFFSKSMNFLNIKLLSLIDNCEKTKPTLLNDITLLNKSLSNYENTSLSSILTGEASNSILLRRFIRFIHSEIKFFKNTSLIIKANSQIFLSGLSICGLYINQKKIKNPNNDLNNNLLNRGSIDIKINIFPYDIESNNKGEIIFNEDFKIYGIIDHKDPSQIINFSKGVKFLSDQNYLITIENISKDCYCDLWVGNTGNIKNKDTQTIKCHNTQTEFVFMRSKGIQTDFEEFTSGIIVGFLYSKN